MAEPVRVFVSHHHSAKEDASTARLVADLEAAGADVSVTIRASHPAALCRRSTKDCPGGSGWCW